MSTATAVRTQDFPRVNLLPPEIAEEQRFRALRAVMLLVVVGAVVSVGALWYVAAQSVSSAEDSLAAAQAQQTVLRAEAATYAEVPLVYAQVAAGEAALDLAMGNEIRYSFVLNDLSLTIPNDVSLSTIVVSQDIDGATPVTSALGNPAVGTVTFTGLAYKHNNVAKWLSSLTKSDYYVDPYFSSSTEGEIVNNKQLIEFNSSVSMTDLAYSNRYTTSGS